MSRAPHKDVSNGRMFMLNNGFEKMLARVADITCITQVALKFINKVVINDEAKYCVCFTKIVFDCWSSTILSVAPIT